MNLATERVRVPWSVWTIALLALAGHVLLLTEVPLGPWLLPLSAAVALLLGRPRLPSFGGIAAIAVVGISAAAIAYGSIATLDRSWDGLATWTANARWLAVDGTLQHAYFRDPAVLNLGRGYPLLQPMLLAQGMTWLGEHGARVLFPALWLLLVATLATALGRTALSQRSRAVAVLGLALVPIFVEPGRGSAESGFADLLVAVVLLLVAIALTEDLLLLALVACFLLPLCKNEGLVHAMIFTGAAGLAGRHRAAIGFAIGGSCGMALWILLQRQLMTPAPASAFASLLPALLPVAAAGLAMALAAPRTRWAAVVAVVVIAVALPWFDSFAETTVGQALRSLVRLDLEWANVPAILGHGLQNLVFVRKLGLTFVILIATVIVVARRVGLGPTRPLLLAIVIGNLAIMVFMASRPGANLELFLREGLVRYTAQWAGVCWLAIGLLWSRLS
ncbi:MAG: hypothetical protein KDC98_08725 [Planctomycetes bacterium]|nr:hypothetical protein [Planctomycetota bacterium]